MGISNEQRLILIVSCLSVLLALAAGARLPSIHAGVRDDDAVAAFAPAPSAGHDEAGAPVPAPGAGEEEEGRRAGGFVRTSGARFMVGGRPFYSNGFNAYWLMYMASNPGDRSKVVDTLDQASRLGATLIRTWAFNDGGSNRPLQISPGVYNEDTFLVRTPTLISYCHICMSR
jgi:hypothetical protein